MLSFIHQDIVIIEIHIQSFGKPHLLDYQCQGKIISSPGGESISYAHVVRQQKFDLRHVMRINSMPLTW
jgi:hypothetical protein